MKQQHWILLSGILTGIACLLVLAVSMNINVFGQSKAAQTMSDDTKTFRLSESKVKEVRAKTEFFYGTQDLPDFAVKAAKSKHIGRKE